MNGLRPPQGSDTVHGLGSCSGALLMGNRRRVHLAMDSPAIALMSAEGCGWYAGLRGGPCS